MGKKRKEEREVKGDSVVKIDSEILEQIEDFIKKNKYLYSSKKQVVNLALLEFLKKRGKNGK